MCVIVNSAEWWAEQVDSIMEQVGFPQGDAAASWCRCLKSMQPAKRAFQLVSTRGIESLAAYVFGPIKTPLANLVQNPDQAGRHAEQAEALLRERVASMTPTVGPALARGLAPVHIALATLTASRLLAHLYSGRALPRRSLQRLLAAVLQLSSCLKDLPFLTGTAPSCSAQERSELERHVERELAKVQHVLALLEMPAELVVQQYGALTDNPTPQGLAKVLQLRGASEADIATAVEQLHRMGMGRETATPPPPSQWVPHPGQVITQGSFRGEHLASGLLRITEEGGLTLSTRREALFNKLWSIIVTASSEH
eukprot:EG_transcript_17959